MNLDHASKNILITGAGGFLGREIIRQTCGLNRYNIFALTSDTKELSSAFNHANLNILGIEEWENRKLPLLDMDFVIHCAFSRSNNGKELSESLIFTQKVLTDAMMHNCAVINVSSRSVYGQNPNTPWKEETLVEPDSLYALAKYSSELILQSMSKLSQNLHFTNIRLAGLVGNQSNDRITNKFIDNVINNKPINIIGGKQKFAYIDVRDASEGIISLLKIPSHKWKPMYNLGYLKSYGIIEIAEIVAKIANKYNFPAVEINLKKTDDNLYAEMDSSLFYEDTNWQPAYDMEAIVSTIFEHQIKNRL